MLEITLKNIILDRKFGTISIGNSKQDVIQKLGEPDAEGILCDNSQIIRYGWYEFIFKNEKLDLFFNKHVLNNNYQLSNDFHYSNEKFSVSTYFVDFEQDLKIKYFEKWLNQKSIPYTKNAFWDSIKLIINENTEMMFYNKHLDGRDVKSQNELKNDQKLFEDEENWIFAGFYVLRSKNLINQ